MMGLALISETVKTNSGRGGTAFGPAQGGTTFSTLAGQRSDGTSFGAGSATAHDGVSQPQFSDRETIRGTDEAKA